MATNQNKNINRLLNFFGLALKSDNNNNTKSLVPGKPSKKQDTFSNPTPIDFPSDIQKALEYFIANYDISSNSERFNRYNQLLFMVRSSGIMSSASQIYTEETFESKKGERPIQIKAKDKEIETLFYTWLDSIGFNLNVLREISWNLTVFGDAFWVNSIDLDNGIIGVNVIDPFLVKDKLEFSLNNLGQTKNWKSSVTNLTNRYKSLSKLAQLIDSGNIEDEDYALYYQSYILGYEIRTSVAQDSDSKVLPPWAITHFRHFSTQSEFFPFGRPLFINSIARFKSYMTTEMLIDLLRVASFPKEKITVKGGDTLSPLDRRIKLQEVKQMIENMTPKTEAKDNLTIGDRIYDMDDLYEYDILDPGVDIDSLGDLEMKLDDLILTIGIPDSYLIPSKGSGMGGENATALLYNNKIFQRRVIGNKSAILEGITHTFRMHLDIIQKFDGAETEFELFMPTNIESFSDDEISFNSDSLKLASDMIETISSVLGLDRGEQLPISVVKDILYQYIPIDSKIIDKWVNAIMKQKNAENENDTNSQDAPEGTNKFPFNKKEKTESIKIKKITEAYKEGKLDNLLRETYFKIKNEIGITNGLIGTKVYYNNSRQLKENKNKVGYQYSVYRLLSNQKLNKKLQEKKVDVESNE